MPKTVAEQGLSLHDFHGFQTSHEPRRNRLRKIMTRNVAIAARHQAVRRRRAHLFQVWYVLNHLRLFGGFGMVSEPSSWVGSRRSIRDVQIFQAAVFWLTSAIYEDSRPASRGDDSTR